MNKHQRNIRIVYMLSQMVTVITFICLLGSVENNIHTLLVGLAAFGASVAMTFIVKNADKILRHIVAIFICVFAFISYLFINISKYSIAVNCIRHDVGGYGNLYYEVLELYDSWAIGKSDKIIKVISKQDTAKYEVSVDDYIPFMKEVPYDPFACCKDPILNKKEPTHIRDTRVIRYVQSEDTSKRCIVGCRMVKSI